MRKLEFLGINMDFGGCLQPADVETIGRGHVNTSVGHVYIRQ